MTKREHCPKCGSSRVMSDVRIVDGALEEEVRAEVHRKPDAKLFKGAVRVSLKAHVCGECGFTELYAADPAQLFEAQKG